jgi:uracil-DNA glycosylase
MELTLLVGGYAQVWTLGRRAKKNMTETVRAWREYADEGFIPLPHQHRLAQTPPAVRAGGASPFEVASC